MRYFLHGERNSFFSQIFRLQVTTVPATISSETGLGFPPRLGLGSHSDFLVPEHCAAHGGLPGSCSSLARPGNLPFESVLMLELLDGLFFNAIN